MRLPHSVKSQLNPRIGHTSEASRDRDDWHMVGGEWRTEDGRYRILSDVRYGLVVAQVKNVTYSME